MTTDEKIFKITATEKDCFDLSDFLNETVRAYRQKYNDTEVITRKQEYEMLIEKAIRYRNYFGEMADCHYIGEDS